MRGPGAQRDRPGRVQQASARLFRKTANAQIRVVTDEGQLLEQPSQIEEEMWKSRKEIWATC
eukprot:11040134-Lingulodinium_polyedra.AAC.1